MAQMAYVCLYQSYLESLSALSYSSKGRLLDAMLLYARDGQEPKLTGTAKVLWPMIRSQIDRDQLKYRQLCEINRIKGAKGALAKAAASRSLAQAAAAAKEKEKEKENENENENVNDKVNENDKENGNEKEKEKENEREKEKETSAQSACAPLPSFPPSEAEVLAYCRQQGLCIDVSQFVDYYTSNGWMVGKNKMQDWQAAVRNWSRKELEFGKTELERPEPIYGNIL